MKKIEELTLEELKALYENNAKFRDLVFYKVAEDVEQMLCDEELRSFPGSFEFGCVYATKVSLTTNRYGYIKWSDVVAWVEHVEKTYSFLWLDMEPDALELAKKCETLQGKLGDDCNSFDKFGNLFELSSENYKRIEKRLEELTDELTDRIKCAIDSRIDIDDCYVLDELEYNRSWLCDAMYIDDNNNVYEFNKVA